MKDNEKYILECIGYVLVIIGIALLYSFLSVLTKKKPKLNTPKCPFRGGSLHYRKTRQRRAYFAKK